MATKPLDHALTEAPLWRPGQPFQPPTDDVSDEEIRKQIKREQRAYKREIERLTNPKPRGKTGPKPSGLPFGLSERQLQAMRLTIEGKTAAQIARDMNAAVKTVEEHLWRSVQKIGGTNRVHAAVLLDRVLRS